jgi:hypothetical protein
VTAPVPPDPAPGRAPVSQRAAQAMPGGPSAAPSPRAAEGGPASPPLSERHAAGKPSPETRAEAPADMAAALARGRPQSPAGGASSALCGTNAPSAGSRPLSGAEWRQAVRDAQSAQGKARRRKPARAAAAGKRPATVPILPAAGPVSVLTATAHCGGCEWTAGPGSPGEVDKAAEKHVSNVHATATIAELAGVA